MCILYTVKVAMSYPDLPKDNESARQFPDRLATRREMAAPLLADNKGEIVLPGLRYTGAQNFVGAVGSVNTEYTTLLLNWQTGAGKTLGMLSIAKEYVKLFMKTGGSIVVLASPGVRATIMKEILSRPEHGFVKSSDIDELNRLRVMAAKRGTTDSDEARAYNNKRTALMRRVSDARQGGMYRFSGYKEFSNRVFTVTTKGQETEFDVSSLASASNLVQAVKLASEYVTVDDEYVQSLSGCLLVCDEAHHLYNSSALNTYGVAVQYALDVLGRDLRVVYMTATIAGGSAGELVEMANLLTPAYQRPDGIRYKRSDFFKQTPEGSIAKGGALERLAVMYAGRISFLREVRSAGEYPPVEYVGEELPGLTGTPIPLYRFTKCPMSQAQAKTLANYRVHRTTGASSKTLGTEAWGLYDMVFPNPEYADPASETALGLYQDPVSIIGAASIKWQEHAHAHVIGEAVGGGYLDPEHLSHWSSKYYAYATDMNEAVGRSGKHLAYHNRIHNTGVLTITQILIQWGWTPFGGAVSAKAKCSLCGLPQRGHDAALKTLKPGPNIQSTEQHKHVPARFAVLHYHVDRTETDKILETFNSPDNLRGNDLKLILGTNVVAEGLDFKALQYISVLSAPTDFSTLMQIVGRGSRRNSHVGLPPNEQKVVVRIYITAPAKGGASPSPEEHRYAHESAENQMIERAQESARRFASDAGTPEPGAIDNLTFYAYGYGTQEVELIKQTIRVLVERHHVWTYDDLYETVRKPGVIKNLGVDPRLFKEENFAQALSALTVTEKNITPVQRMEAAAQTAAGRQAFGIVFADPYYVRVPMDGNGLPMATSECYLRDTEPLQNIKVGVTDYIKNNRQDRNYALQLEEFQQLHADDKSDLLSALVNYSPEFHYRLMKELILGVVKKSAAIKRIEQVYRWFHMVVTHAEVKTKVPHAAAMLKGKKGDDLVGFVRPNQVELPMKNGNSTYLTRASLGYGPRFDENEIVIGYSGVPRGNKQKFKVRKPRQVLQQQKMRDLRSLETGAVCETRPREELLDLLHQLGKDKATRYMGVQTTKTLCDALRIALLEREMKVRQAGDANRRMLTSKRWFYLFNDPQPTLAHSDQNAA
jgi:hypothetical protein